MIKHPLVAHHFASAMSSPEQLVRELGDVPELLEAQVVAGLCRDEVIEALFRSWSSRLANIGKLSDKAKTMLTTAISSGPWSQQQIKDLASIALQGGTSKTKPGGAKNRRNNQKILSIENYVSMATMVKLRDPKYSRLSRASMLAQEARAIGIELPDLPSLFRMVALLAFTEGTWTMSQDDVWNLMDRIQEYIKAVPRNASIPWLEHYPVSAAELSKDMIAAIYPSGILPVVVEMPELDAILKGHKMKGRDGKSSKKMPAWLNTVPEEHRATVLSAIRGTLPSSSAEGSSLPATMPGPSAGGSFRTGHTADIFRFSRPAQPPKDQSQAAAPAVPMTKPATSKTSKYEDIEGKTDHEKTEGEEEVEEVEEDAEEDEEKDEEENDDDITAYEKKMLAALHSRPTSKGPKSKAMKKPAASAAVLKRPAAKATAAHAPTLKKPAAAGGIQKKPTARKIPKSSTWKLIHTAIYNKVRAELFAKTGNDEKSKELARAACKRAKAKFLAGTLKDPRFQS